MSTTNGKKARTTSSAKSRKKSREAGQQSPASQPASTQPADAVPPTPITTSNPVPSPVTVTVERTLSKMVEGAQVSEPVKRLPASQPTSAQTVDADSPAGVPMKNPVPGLVFVPVEDALSKMGEGNQIAQIVRVVGLALLRGLIAPCELLLRYQFGERYFSPPVTLGFFLALGYAAYSHYLSPATVGFLLVAYLAGRSYHQRACYRRDRRGEYWHSYSEGISRLRLASIDRRLAQGNFTIDFSKLVIEPVVLIGLGILLNFLLIRIDTRVRPFWLPSSAQYLIAAGIASLFYQLYCWGERRRMILDEKDARVLAEVRRLADEPSTGPELRRHSGVAFTTRPAATPWQR